MIEKHLCGLRGWGLTKLMQKFESVNVRMPMRNDCNIEISRSNSSKCSKFRHCRKFDSCSACSYLPQLSNAFPNAVHATEKYPVASFCMSALLEQLASWIEEDFLCLNASHSLNQGVSYRPGMQRVYRLSCWCTVFSAPLSPPPRQAPTNRLQVDTIVGQCDWLRYVLQSRSIGRSTGRWRITTRRQIVIG